LTPFSPPIQNNVTLDANRQASKNTPTHSYIGQRKNLFDLCRVAVVHNIHGRLAFAYKNKNEDVDSKLLEASPAVRRVIRRVTSTYWFIREVLRDAPDLLIVSPENVRSLVKEKLKTLYQRYNLEISS
jgi:predicted DNA-binding transcriptional regulator YafY